MTGNCTLFMDKQHYCAVIYAVKQTVSSLELIGSVFIVLIIWLFKTYKYFNQRLILALSVAALGESICILLTGVPQERGALCQLQAWLVTYCVLAVLSWVCCITFNIWRAMRFAMRGDIADERLLGSREWCYHLISWGVPLVVATLPFSEGVYGPAGPWCWVAGTFKDSALWRFTTYYIPLFICIIGLFSAYTYFFVTFRRQARRWEGIHTGNNATEQEQKKVWMNYVKSMLAYPSIYLGLSIAPFIHRVYNAVTPEPSFVLILLHVVSIPLTGLINAIAFGLSKDILSKLNRHDMKAAFQRHFPFGNPKGNSFMGEHRLGECTTTEIHHDVSTPNTGYDNPAMEENA